MQKLQSSPDVVNQVGLLYKTGWLVVQDRLACCTRQVDLYKTGWLVVQDRLACCTRQVGLLYKTGWLVIQDRLACCTRQVGSISSLVVSVAYCMINKKYITHKSGPFFCP